MSEPRRILYCLDTLGAGGVERQTVALITRLDRRQYAPAVLCLHAGRQGSTLHFLPELQRAGVPVEILDLRWRPLEIVTGLARVIPAVRRIRPAIVHAVNHHGNHLLRLARPFLPPSLRLITAVRTDYNARQLWYERVLHYAARRVVCNSPHLEVKLRERSRIPARKLRYIPNGLDCARFATNPDPGWRARHAPDARRVVAMLGRITLQKSPHLLAEALGRLKQRNELPPGLRVVIAGDPESARIQQQLDDAVTRHGLGSVITQLPATSQAEAIYHAADFTVLASLWEGLPNVVIESLAAGRPALVSEAANAAGVVTEGVTGWVTRTNDVPALAQRLGEVLRLADADLAGMREACQRRATDFSMERMVARYHDLYAELLVE